MNAPQDDQFSIPNHLPPPSHYHHNHQNNHQQHQQHQQQENYEFCSTLPVWIEGGFPIEIETQLSKLITYSLAIFIS